MMAQDSGRTVMATVSDAISRGFEAAFSKDNTLKSPQLNGHSRRGNLSVKFHGVGGDETPPGKAQT